MTSMPAAGHAARRIKAKGLRPTVIAPSQNQQIDTRIKPFEGECVEIRRSDALSESNG